jgi:hypothetical protein
MYNNSQWPVAMRQAGGDDLGGGLSIPPYMFLLNGWRVRPMESNHLLNITGNLFVDGGGAPVVNTIGAFNVSVQYTVPVQAQAIATGGNVYSLAQIGTAVRSELAPELNKINAQVDGLTPSQLILLTEVYQLYGLDMTKPLVVTDTSRTAGTINQTIAKTPTQTTVTRV